jgi:hypothetical protein
MKKNFLFLTTCIISCCLYFTTQAQEPDSGYLNLGRTRLKNEFTQTFSIKPEYLEKMPFANLTEAISAWLYGHFTNTSTIVYIVDGNIAPDVNVYNIHDIEEITLVQNAIIQLNGATGQAQLVVIKTKRNQPGRSGVSVAGQLFLVNNTFKNQTDNSTHPSDNNLYHQYTISAYQNKKNIQYGASVNYQRDVLPAMKADSITTYIPENFNRFRINTYLNVKLGRNNELFVNVNYTPQRSRFSQLSVLTTPAYSGSFKEDLEQSEKLFTTLARLHSKISKSWSNDFIAGYDLLNANGSLPITQTYIFPTAPINENTTLLNFKNKYNTLFLGDQIHYTRQIGDWLVEPSLDIRYSRTNVSDQKESIYTASNYNSSNSSISSTSTNLKGNNYLLTPSFILTYKNIVSVQAGILKNLSSFNNPDIKKSFPFISFSLDAFKIAKNSAPNSFKIFASYATTADLDDPNYQLSDFTTSPASGNKINSNFSLSNGNVSFGNSIPNYFANQINHSTWIAEGGISWTTFHNRIFLSYNYERRAFNAPVEISIPNPPNYTTSVMIYPLVVSSTHRLVINMKIIEKEKIDIFSGITVANISINKNTGYYNNEYTTGDYGTSKPSFTGGWVNRVRYHNFMFGLDIMYHINEQILPTNGNYLLYSQQTKNCLLLQNVSFGYKIKSYELYITGRNLFQNSTGDLTNYNRYYGVGFKSTIF